MATPNQTELQKLATTTISDLEAKVKLYAKDLQAGLHHTPADGEWYHKIRVANDARKQEINQMLDDSMNKAMSIIERLPENNQSEAADRLTAWWDYLMVAVKKIIEFLDRAGQAIGDFLTGRGRLPAERVGEMIKEWESDAQRTVSMVITRGKDILQETK